MRGHPPVRTPTQGKIISSYNANQAPGGIQPHLLRILGIRHRLVVQCSPGPPVHHSRAAVIILRGRQEEGPSRPCWTHGLPRPPPRIIPASCIHRRRSWIRRYCNRCQRHPQRPICVVRWQGDYPGHRRSALPCHRRTPHQGAIHRAKGSSGASPTASNGCSARAGAPIPPQRAAAARGRGEGHFCSACHPQASACNLWPAGPRPHR